MKYRRFLFPQTFLLFITLNALSQESKAAGAGLYATAEDFANQKLTSAIDCRIKSATRSALKNSSAFAVRTCDNKLYRLVKGEKYQIVDSSGFMLYYRYETEWLGKGSSMVKTGKYYFSASAGSDIMPLTIANLEKTFSANKKFRYALEAQFREDRDLTAYDKFVKKYKVNTLYCMSR